MTVASSTYDIGDLVQLVATFTDPESGDPVDPTTVVCTVRDPAGTTSTPAVSGSAGVYVTEVAPAVAGHWLYAFDGSGAHQASAEGRFYVRAQTVTR